MQPCQVTVWGEVSPDVSRCRGQTQSGQQRVGGMSPDEYGGLADSSVVANGTRWHRCRGDAIIALVYRSVWQLGADFGDGIVMTGTVLDIVQNGMLKMLSTVRGNVFKQSGELGSTKRTEPTGYRYHGARSRAGG
jgi:hypothetical protein